MSARILDDLRKLKPARVEDQLTLFESPKAKADPHWWGMPDFDMQDTRPLHSITVSFLTKQDIARFEELTGCSVTEKTKGVWFPYRRPIEKLRYYWGGPPTNSRYPVCIPSKGRAAHQKTGKALDKMGVDYRFFVEETEAEQYIAALGAEKVVVMPFHDLGQGSIPARNFIWEWAKERGFRRHWVVDDNITSFTRAHFNRRLRVFGGGFFRAMEDFVDRYENIPMAGPHGQGFVEDSHGGEGPILWNSRVYSCILLDTQQEERWRGRYNEDTDLSLRFLKKGLPTLLFRTFCMAKASTAGSKGRPTPGGNTDNVYNTGDHRLAFAKSLQEQHPDVVSVEWKHNRWHHTVDYIPFKKNAPILKNGITVTPITDEYGMVLMERDRDEQESGDELSDE